MGYGNARKSGSGEPRSQRSASAERLVSRQYVIRRILLMIPSIFGISVQTWAQGRISPTRAAVIFSMEAPFAALAAFLLADERLASRAWLGAALILAGMLIVELKPATSKQEA